MSIAGVSYAAPQARSAPARHPSKEAWAGSSERARGAGRSSGRSDARNAHRAAAIAYFFSSAHFDSAGVVKAWSPGIVATTFR